MAEVLAGEPPIQRRRPLFLTAIRECVPSLRDSGLASLSAILLVLSFPNFELWWLAWIGLAPLLFAVATTSRKRTAFVLGLIWGLIFLYGTCWWLTYPMIHHAGVSPLLAYPLFLIPVVFVSVFPATACLGIAILVDRFGSFAILASPVVWVAFDWLRRAITGFDWNALGYSQASHPFAIQTARWGGVFATSFTLTLVCSAIALLLIRRDRKAVLVSAAAILCVTLIVAISARFSFQDRLTGALEQVVAVQPNVPMAGLETPSQMNALLQRHLVLTRQGFLDAPDDVGTTLLVIWPESPMNFNYSHDTGLQKAIGEVTRQYSGRLPVYVLLNSLESAPNGGSYNSAILMNEQGRKIAQYDKIRLMPFGEYVPLPRWLPGSGSVRSIVGEFTPGSSYTLMPLGALRAGVFICVEAAHADIARAFTNTGADVLINISNDGYLGPTPVMRQHLATSVFRAVENNRDVVRVTNSGITARISARGEIYEMTSGFQEAVRTWTVVQRTGSTFYSRHGDVFAYGCALITLGFVSATLMTRRKGTHGSGVLTRAH